MEIHAANGYLIDQFLRSGTNQRTDAYAGGKGLWIAKNSYDREGAAATESGKVDAIAFGKAFISNPDLVQRLKENAALNEPNQQTFYGSGAEDYTDYPSLA